MPTRNRSPREITDTSDRTTRDLGYAHQCEECGGHTLVYKGRVKVNHRLDCETRLRLLLTHPKLRKTLELYRNSN